MKKIMISIAAVCALFFFVSCGGSSEERADDGVDGSEMNDSNEISDADPGDDEPKELLYPEVTATSNKNGDIAQNVVLYDDLDVEHQLAEWYKANNPSSKLVWLIFTTYDCSPCQVLKLSLSNINKKEYRDKGFNVILVFNGLLSGPQTELEPKKIADYKEVYLWEYPDTGQFALYSYLKKQNIFQKFASTDYGIAYPTWAFIDASTMEILIYGQGWDEEMETTIMNDIELILDEF